MERTVGLDGRVLRAFAGVMMMLPPHAVVRPLVAGAGVVMIAVGCSGLMVIGVVVVIMMVAVEADRAGHCGRCMVDTQRMLHPVEPRHRALLNQHRHQRHAAHGEEGSQLRPLAVEH